jgi:hypothetical protein
MRHRLRFRVIARLRMEAEIRALRFVRLWPLTRPVRFSTMVYPPPLRRLL